LSFFACNRDEGMPNAVIDDCSQSSLMLDVAEVEETTCGISEI